MLSDQEWSLIVHLLEEERHDLPISLQHGAEQAYADAQDDRRMLIDDLIQRLRAQGMAN